MVSSCLQMEVSVTGTVGTLAQQQCAAALGSAKDATTEAGGGGGRRGEDWGVKCSSHFSFLFIVCSSCFESH